MDSANDCRQLILISERERKKDSHLRRSICLVQEGSSSCFLPCFAFLSFSISRSS